MRYVLSRNIIFQLFIPPLIFLFVVHISLAQVMSSGSYKIESDSVNVGGGYSTSSNYTLESTVGEVATGVASSTTYALRAGYQQMHEVFLSMDSIADITLSPSLSGITGGNSTGSAAVHIVTDSLAGYQLTIAAATSPALQSGVNTIADYVPVAGLVPDFSFTTGASDAHFGFSPEGSDIATRFQDNVGACGVSGGDTADSCWDGLSTSATIIAVGSTSNHPAGATTTIKFQVGIGGSIVVTSGTYEATTTVTAIPL